MIAAKPINPGTMDRRVTLRYSTELRDSGGASLPAWVEVTPVWASWLPQNGREFTAMQARYATLSALVRIRYRADVTSTWRATLGGRLYKLVAPPVEVGRTEYLDLPLETTSPAEAGAQGTTVLLATAYHESANNAGNTAIAPNALCLQHTERVNFTGAGSTTRKLILSTVASYLAGQRLLLDLQLPATADISVEVRNATAGGTLIETILSDASGDNATVELIWTGTAWQKFKTTYPA